MTLSKSGIPGRNKRGKSTTAAKLAKKREQKRNDRAWIFGNDRKDCKDGRDFADESQGRPD